jgi:dephospho-CoA kinase
MRRDANDAAQVKQIMAAQLERPRRLAGADIVIDNSGSLEELQTQVQALHERLLLTLCNIRVRAD